jgi:Zn finger protein HypA/HybF involved in hydrogenase expression
MKTAALVTGVMLLGVPSCGVVQPDHPDIVADLACETARMAEKLKQEMAPAPASDKCENCDGTGKIGDGRIVMNCPVCKGTGKKVAK